jgi:ppGpp synthetase/RelA/SpoT-type nucleotidyltranferase
LEGMEWTVPKFERSIVNRAGRSLTDATTTLWDADYERALEVVNNWRAAHNFPLNTFQAVLRYKTKAVVRNALVAQRMKRLPSVLQKLRNETSMRLTQMQDIGGCRSIVGSLAQLRQLENLFKAYKKHKFHHPKDYILNPRPSGYRGVHLIYEYCSVENPQFNGLKIEIQLRTRLQHAWATAVETVGAFMHQALKASRGEEKWLQFFRLMGTAMAIAEGTEPVAGTPCNIKELRSEIADCALNLDVEGHLLSYGLAIQTPRTLPDLAGARHFLLELDTDNITVTVSGYKQRQLQKAQADLWKKEREIAGRPEIDAVLVSVDSVAMLKRAYPNYFSDAHVFLTAMKQVIDPKAVPGPLNLRRARIHLTDAGDDS